MNTWHHKWLQCYCDVAEHLNTKFHVSHHVCTLSHCLSTIFLISQLKYWPKYYFITVYWHFILLFLVIKIHPVMIKKWGLITSQSHQKQQPPSPSMHQHHCCTILATPNFVFVFQHNNHCKYFVSFKDAFNGKNRFSKFDLDQKLWSYMCSMVSLHGGSTSTH